MNKVFINVQDINLPSWSERASEFALKVLDEVKRDNWELSILFCGNKTITELNSQYRHKNEPTDILSFNLGETVKKGRKSIFLPGDIVISLDSMCENAKYYKTTPDEELRRLLIHGILHLDGMNHKTNKPENEPMLSLQEEILLRLREEHIIGGGK